MKNNNSTTSDTSSGTLTMRDADSLLARLIRKIVQGPKGWLDLARAASSKFVRVDQVQAAPIRARKPVVQPARKPVVQPARKPAVQKSRPKPNLAPFHLYIPFAQNAELDAQDFAADVYVAHGVQAIPAADAMAIACGGRVICDCIEIPSFAQRVLPSNWSRINTRFIDRTVEGYLRHCDSLITVGWELGKELETYGRPVHVIPNYRYAEELQPSNRLREKCGIGPDTPLVLAISNITSGLEAVLEGISGISQPVHLAVMGHLKPAAYREKCEMLVQELGLEGRVHFFDPVPYDELTSTASAADVGLIVRDPVIPNNFVSLPNRIFDYLFSALPIVTPDIPDIARIVREENAGVVIEGIGAGGWRKGILQALEYSAEMKRNALAASRKYVWESLEDQLFEALGRPKSVTFVGYTDLNKNNRTMRMAASLRKMGVTANVYTSFDAEMRRTG
ncbi:glycosyltransferase [Oricola thermophila]|uniref:Glycosyltransferase n=1 Tax=Oricola thermophila TaxID=2742145 RepID=A0A6N1VCY7_9HYPH|nr:glycosyltransferase [Oricola thermophila]QKV18776.1 glycosyltransferase [Oricola thermophila]